MRTQSTPYALPLHTAPSPAARLDQTLGRCLWLFLGLALLLAT